MLYALLRLIRSEPKLAVDQLEAYARLVGAQFGSTATLLRRRLLLQAVGWSCLAVAMMFGGAALMLWAAMPHELMPLPWLLAAVPLTPALIGVLALLASPRVPMAAAAQVVRDQVELDLAALRDAAGAGVSR